ncbi:MAG: DegT/DnrJ/EryC1/StrS family aminotransferase, partial [Polaribacter sp.]|nr:DegT/DnrJ/EryC1/StrS family aminotransferase [Polaribacter sp.]
MNKIYAARPSIDKKDIDHVIDAVKNGWNDKRDYYLKKLSLKFSKYVGRKYSIPLSSGTAAIHLALIGIGIKKNDEVIVPDFTWTASASPITYLGAKPVFCDVDRNTLCLRVKDIQKCITKKTKAVIVVDLYGGSPDWSEIINFCKKKNIKIIEDSAESLGAYYKNKPIGSFGEISIFSFQATKILSSGLGGMLSTNNKTLYTKWLLYHHHGINKNSDKYYWSNDVGFNYQMTNMQAALVLSQLNKIKKL